MSNHIHILATGGEDEAGSASAKELERRYGLIFGEDKDIPQGSYEGNGEINYDEDYGIERLRQRLGSISRFMQEIKQSFSRWYNKRHNRKGYLWGDRFKGVLVSKGNAMLAASAYIDLNPVRAGIVQNPEDYQYSSMGMRVRAERKLKTFTVPFEIEDVSQRQSKAFYRLFVFESGAIEVENKASIPSTIVVKVQKTKGKLNLGTKLSYRCANFSDGLAIGTKGFIEKLQTGWGRKIVRGRSLIPEDKKSKDNPVNNADGVFVTRVLS